MKSVKRRLLSLLLAMVMVLSLAPSALAADPPASGGDTGTTNPDTPPVHNHTYETEWTADDTQHWHKCSGCNVKGDATNHTWTVKSTQPATCTTDGQKISVCDVCKYELTEPIKATGHDFKDGVCTVCGAKDPNYSVKPSFSIQLNELALNTSTNSAGIIRINDVDIPTGTTPGDYKVVWSVDKPDVASFQLGTSGSYLSNFLTSGSPNKMFAGADIVAKAAGTAIVTATVTYSGEEVCRASTKVTVEGLSDTLTAASKECTVSVGAWSNAITVTANTSDAYRVVWSIHDDSSIVLNTTSSLSDASILKNSYFANGNKSTSILAYGKKAGHETLSATLYDVNNNQLGPSVTVDVYVREASTTLTPSASSVTVPYGGWNTQFYATASANAASAGATGVKWTITNYNTTTTPVLLNSTSVVSSSSVSITTPLSATNRTASIALYGQKVGTANLRAVLVDSAGNEIGTPRAISVTVGSALSISPSTTRLTAYGSRDTLYARFNNVAITTDTVSWTCGSNGATSNGYITLTNNKNGTVTVTALANTPSTGTTVTATYRDSNGVTHTATATVHVGISASNVATVTVYNTSSYNLNDPDDVGGSSIISQLESYFSSYYAGNAGRYYGLESVVFGERTNTYGSLNATVGTRYYVGGRSGYGTYPLENIVFTPTSSRTGTATFNITAYVYYDSYRYDPTPVSCTISFRVTEGTVAGGDVTYTASMGDNVYFRSGDFEDFWDDNFPRGTLTSVRFSVSGGTLRDSNGKTVGTAECYVSARSNQIDLDDVYFEPNSTNSKKAGTIRFNFTATGYARNSNQSVTRTGTVSIIYLSASPKDITYTVGTNGSVNLKASDFTAAYKEATGSTAPTGLTIVLQNVPSRGSLSYTDSSKSSASAVRLTSSNIKSRNFTTRSSGTNQINDVSYTGTSGTDTVEYIAYSGSTAQFSGKIVFNGAAPAPTDITVTFTSTSGAAAQFTQAAFTTANATVMAKTTRIRFTTPSNGNLLLSGTSSAAGVDIAPTSLGSVTYRPKAGYNGNDRCMFMCYDSTGTLVGSGTVTLVVVGNPTTTTPTTPSNGATSVSQFKDVPANAWYRTELADLVSKGIINGTSATTFAPNSAVNYGAALKMILRAAGYSAQEETGNNWAIHYKELAVSKGWISNDIALNDPIPRGAMADLTAKVLGISPSSAASPFADTANGYAVALYETKIFTGTPGENGGKPNFLGSNNLTRAQICAVIYRVNQYYETISSSQKPDGL